MQGDRTAAHATTPAATATAGFIRCRFLGDRWHKKWTRNADQPADGFTLPAAVSEIDVARLCRSYERIDADARDLLRLMARTLPSRQT